MCEFARARSRAPFLRFCMARRNPAIPASLHLMVQVFCLLGFASMTSAQQSSTSPRVIIPSTSRNAPPTSRIAPTTSATVARTLYPWKLHITSTAFWIGETPTRNNPVPNDVSSWDTNWVENYGGYDDPDPMKRVASHNSGDFRPKHFVPKLNPFYVALPYNDKQQNGYRPEASKVIPWFHRIPKHDQRSTLKGRWLQIYTNNRSCYAQWEDVGPFEVDDWRYVFGNSRPINRKNQGAGIDISPAVRDYLGITNSSKVHWRFVEESQVPFGPWKKYGAIAKNDTALPNLDAQQRYFEYLKRVRDEQFRRKTKSQLENGQ